MISLSKTFIFICFLTTCFCVTSYVDIFTMKVSNSSSSFTSSIPYVKYFDIGNVSKLDSVYILVQKILFDGTLSKTDFQFDVFLKNKDESISTKNLYNASISQVTVPQNDSYKVIINQFYSSNVSVTENVLNRYIVTVKFRQNKAVYYFASVLSYYYEKYIYLNESQSVNFSISSDTTTLTTETINLIQISDFLSYATSVSSQAFVNPSINEISFSFDVIGGHYYVMRISNAVKDQNYTIKYSSDSYICSQLYPNGYIDTYKVFQPCCPTPNITSTMTTVNHAAFLVNQVCIDCTQINHSNGYGTVKNSIITQCNCEAGFYWNPEAYACESSCTAFSSRNCEQGDCQNVSFLNNNSCIQCSVKKLNSTQCDCSLVGVWNPEVNNCVANCSLFSSAYCGKGECANQNYQWTESKCQIVISYVDIGMIIGIVVGVMLLITLICLYLWRDSVKKCCCPEGENEEIVIVTPPQHHYIPENVDNASSKSILVVEPEILTPLPDDICAICHQYNTTLILDCLHLIHPQCYGKWMKQHQQCPYYQGCNTSFQKSII